MNNQIIKYPKVVVIGAGSLFFGRQSIRQMVYSPYMNKGTLALVDTDEVRLEKMVKLAKMVVETEKVELKIEGSTDRREVLKNADFVILSFARDSAKYRNIDCTISERYGVRMCSGDTIGPGGIFRAMRELPVIMECARDIEEICPDAWVINYINPTAVNGIGLARYAPKLKSFALCDSLHMPHSKIRYAKMAGIINSEKDYNEEISKKFIFEISGVNHFTWLTKAEYEGRDVSPKIAEAIKLMAASKSSGYDAGYDEDIYDNLVTSQMYEIYGYIPTCVGHTKEYVRFWQGHGRTKDKIPQLPIWDPIKRYKRHDEMWKQVDEFISGKLPISDYINTFESDLAIDVVENMVGRLGKHYFINTFNKGTVKNMSDDAYLELCCESSMESITPLPTGDMPRGIRGMQELVLDTHELTVLAVMEQSFTKLRRAMLTDPLINSISDADNIIKELLDQEKDVLPKGWYK